MTSRVGSGAAQPGEEQFVGQRQCRAAGMATGAPTVPSRAPPSSLLIRRCIECLLDPWTSCPSTSAVASPPGTTTSTVTPHSAKLTVKNLRAVRRRHWLGESVGGQHRDPSGKPFHRSKPNNE